MTKTLNARVVLATLLALLTVFMLFATGCSMSAEEINEKNCKKAISEYCKSSSDSLKLSDVTDFDWDAVYFFGPYTGASEIEQAIGIKNDLEPTYNESMHRAVFVKGDKIVCDLIYDGYAISDFKFDNVPFKKRISVENAVFKIVKDKNFTRLKYQGIDSNGPETTE